MRLDWPRFFGAILIAWPAVAADLYMFTLVWPEHPNNYVAALLVGITAISLALWVSIPFILLRGGRL